MTQNEFKVLKIGDRVYLPDKYNNKGKLISTEVLKIDRLFNKVEVLLGGKPKSYRYIRMKSGAVPISFVCGVSNYQAPPKFPFFL